MKRALDMLCLFAKKKEYSTRHRKKFILQYNVFILSIVMLYLYYYMSTDRSRRTICEQHLAHAFHMKKEKNRIRFRIKLNIRNNTL